MSRKMLLKDYVTSSQGRTFIHAVTQDGRQYYKADVTQAMKVWFNIPDSIAYAGGLEYGHGTRIGQFMGSLLSGMKKSGKIAWTGAANAAKNNGMLVESGWIKASRSRLDAMQVEIVEHVVESRGDEFVVEIVEEIVANVKDRGIGGEVQCTTCGHIISRDRIDAMPHTKTCMPCSNVKYMQYHRGI